MVNFEGKLEHNRKIERNDILTGKGKLFSLFLLTVFKRWTLKMKLNWQTRNTVTWKIILLGMFTALSAVIQVIENVILPSSLPIRPGIANIITLLTLSIFGIFEAVLVTGCRSVLAAIATGKLLSVPFLLSMSGGIIAAVTMGLIYNRNKELGVVGVSIVGATVHNFTQLLVIYLVLIKNPGVLNLLPWLWIAALVTGSLVGITAGSILETKLFRNLSDLLKKGITH